MKPPPSPQTTSIEAQVRFDLAQATHDGLPRLTMVVAAVYGLFAVAHAFWLDGQAGIVMPAVAGGTALVFGLFATLSKSWVRPVLWAHRTMAVLAIFVLANCVAHIWLIPEPYLTTNFFLFLLGAGVFILSTPWFLVMVAANWGAWIFIVSISPPSPMWAHFGASMVTITVVTAIAHRQQVQQMSRLFAWRLHERERRDHLEQALASARAADVAKGRFLTGMSHELRTPLNSVIGFSKLLSAGKYGDIGERNQVFAERILDNGQHLLVMIDDILDLAQVESGRLSINLRLTRLEPLVEKLVADLRPQAEEKGLELVLSAPPDGVTLEPILTDPSRLRQILTNLVTNAVKFTERGEVIVRLRNEGEKALAVEVEDSGPGMKAHDLERIFEPFEQLDAGTSRVHGGVGLGLSISRELARALGHSLRVSSELGRGSIFTLDFPELHIDAETPR